MMTHAAYHRWKEKRVAKRAADVAEKVIIALEPRLLHGDKFAFPVRDQLQRRVAEILRDNYTVM